MKLLLTWLRHLVPCSDKAKLWSFLGHDTDLVPDGHGALVNQCQECGRVIEVRGFGHVRTA